MGKSPPNFSILPKRQNRLEKSGLLIDLFSWLLASPIALLIRFDGILRFFELFSFIVFVIFGFSFNTLFKFILRINARNQRLGSIEQLIIMFVASSSTAILLLLIRIVFDFPNLPRSIPILAAIIALTFQIGARILPSKSIRNHELQNPNLQRVLIFGAGSIGHQLAEQFLEYRDIYYVIGFLDDNFMKSGNKILGYKVLGSTKDLGKVADFFYPDILIVAISDLSSEKLNFVREECAKRRVEVRLVPREDQIISGFVQLSDVKSIDEREILGRPQLLQENAEVANLLRNSRVLVTGAAGSIGSEIVRQLHKYKTREVFLLDRDENGLLRTKLELNSLSDLADEDVILADIRDFNHLLEAVEKIKPNIIFHAAALKHVSTLERFPNEALKTNFEGTKNVWKSALSCSVPYFVNISSDKAANPATQLGKSKLLAERVIASTPSEDFVKKYVSVRFGNVIGSSGSFVEIFRQQIGAGGPITVRDPQATRYFMTLKEAVHLVLEALVVGENKETLILDMGKPIKILDVANQMIQASGRKVEIRFTGLHPGEKLHESLYSDGEKITIRTHPKIMHTKVESLNDRDLNVKFI